MALQIDISDSEYGVPFAGAYFRIGAVSVHRSRGGVEKFIVMLDVNGYISRPERDDVRPIDSRRYSAPVSDIDATHGDTWLAKCYTWVASQPDMAGAISI